MTGLNYWCPQTGRRGVIPVENKEEVLNRWRMKAVSMFRKVGSFAIVYAADVHVAGGAEPELRLYSICVTQDELNAHIVGPDFDKLYYVLRRKA